MRATAPAYLRVGFSVRLEWPATLTLCARVTGDSSWPRERIARFCA